MNVKQYGEREKKLVEHFGITKMWDFNQMILSVVEKRGIEATEAILEDLKQHAV
ncbi:hypothetical protein IIU_00834 [Bacillus cereus VD133]|uniref:Uncharacterized protein n=1 Tax=Bacillus cereus VD133 TaxID=1053233 RepID=A0A9W5PVQ9_BACCE|nr:hypothetical protein [Bacillus cereus]EOO39016.1 hypothetical protein IIU_00834 [Bacillus cereus VD133]